MLTRNLSNHFATFTLAVNYYRNLEHEFNYDELVVYVHRKVYDQEIFIGKPEEDLNHSIKLNSEGRYVIEYQL